MQFMPSLANFDRVPAYYLYTVVYYAKPALLDLMDAEVTAGGLSIVLYCREQSQLGKAVSRAPSCRC